MATDSANPGEDRGEDSNPELVRVPYASKFMQPLLREDKTATLRLERYGLEAGDQFIATNEHSGIEWALCEVTRTFTCRGWEAADVLELLDVEHSLTKTDQIVVDVLQPHYDERVHRDDTVKGIVWEVVQRFAEANDGE